MTQQEILTLAKAGFTAQQIAALNQIQPASPEPAPEPAAPEPTPEPAKEPESAAVNNQTVDQILGAINGLQQQIHQSNLQHAQQPAQVQTTDSILASIINPPELDPDRK